MTGRCDRGRTTCSSEREGVTVSIAAAVTIAAVLQELQQLALQRLALRQSVRGKGVTVNQHMRCCIN